LAAKETKMFAIYRPRVRVLAPLLGLALVLAVFIFSLFIVNPQKAEAVTSNTLNFQARLLNSSGTVVPDGNYHIEFKIYDSVSSGASAQGVCSLDSSTDDCWWRETRTTGNLVRVVNGYFSVQLGSVTAFGASIPWDQQLWLTMNIGGTSGPTWDGEMLSSGNRIQLTGVPYAFTAGKLQAADSGVTNVLTFATPSGGNKTLTLPNETGTICTTGSICSGYQASGNYFLQGGNSFTAAAILGTNDSNSLSFETSGATQVTIAVGGATTFRNSADSSAAFMIQNAAGTATLFSADTSNSQLNLVRSNFSGNILAATSATSQTISATNTSVDSSSAVIGQANGIAIGVDGLPIMSYYDNTNDFLRVAKCSDAACSSSTKTTIDDGAVANEGDGTDIAIGADGLPIIAYYTTTGGNLRVTKCANITCSSQTSTTDIETTNNIGRNPRIAMGNDGLAWISHWDTTNTGLRVSKCDNVNCTSATSTAVDTAPSGAANITDIAIGTDGNPVVSYYDAATTSCDDSPTSECSLKVAKFVGSGGSGCTSSAWTCTVVENPTSTSDIGAYNAIAVGSDGLPVVAFYDGTGSTNPKLLRCADTNCTSVSSSVTLDTSGPATTGQEISVAIGNDGLPIVSYKDSTTPDLRVTKCGDLACSSGNVSNGMYALLSATATAEWTNIAILPDGLPVISHYDNTADDLMLTRCANTSCSAVSSSVLTGGIDIGSSNSAFQNLYVRGIKLNDAVNPFTISTNGSERFRIAADGSVLVKNQTSSGFAVQNSTGTSYLNVNTSSGQVALANNLLTVSNHAAEYANNGGAESSTFTMWTGAPAGGTISRYTTAGDNIATGNASVFVDTTSTANTGVRNTLTTALTANLKYAVSFGVRHTSNTSSFTTLNTLFSPDGTDTGTAACATGSTVTYSIWTRITCTFTAPASGITSSNAIFIRHSDGVEHDFYVDNLSVTVSADVNHAADGSVDSALGTNWTAFDADGGAGTTTLNRETTIIYDTSGSVSDVTTANANLGMRNNMTITPSVSTQYRVTFYARSSNTFNDITVGFLPAGGSSVPVSAQLCTDYNTQSVSTTGWTKITCIVTTPASGITDPDLVIYQPSATARTFYVDALTIALNGSVASNVQIGGANEGGPTTLLTLDRSSGPPIAANNDAYLGSMYYDTTTGRIQCYESDGWGACGAPPDNIVNLNPEYPGAVLNGSLTSPNNVGTMTADFCSNDTALTINSTLCSTGQAKNYYRWTSPQASQQTYSIIVTYQLPATFNGFASDDTVQLTARTDSTSNAAVTYEMFKSDGSTVTKCGTSETTVVTSANTWQTVGINGNEATGCSFSSSSAGNFIIFKINLKAQSNANAYVSTLAFTTTGR
jgi:hypothetical protein